MSCDSSIHFVLPVQGWFEMKLEIGKSSNLHTALLTRRHLCTSS
jgi:hypothetical protein